MPNIENETTSFWRVWKHGTHAQINAEIQKNDEFMTQAQADIAHPDRHHALVAAVVRKTGRRIGQEIARKAGRKPKRDTESDDASVFQALPEGFSAELTTAILEHRSVSEILQTGNPDMIDELIFITSRMTGRAVGHELGVEWLLTRLKDMAKKLMQNVSR